MYRANILVLNKTLYCTKPHFERRLNILATMIRKYKPVKIAFSFTVHCLLQQHRECLTYSWSHLKTPNSNKVTFKYNLKGVRRFIRVEISSCFFLSFLIGSNTISEYKDNSASMFYHFILSISTVSISFGLDFPSFGLLTLRKWRPRARKGWWWFIFLLVSLSE